MSLLHPEGPRGSFPRRRPPTDRHGGPEAAAKSRDDGGGSATFDLKAPNRKENPMSHQPSRRDFLKTTAATIAALILPKSLFARNPDKSFWFIHADTR